MLCEIWLMVDSEGQYEVGTSDEEATDSYAESIASDYAKRLIKVVVDVPEFVIPTLKGTVPAEGEAGLTLSTEQ